MNEITFRAVTPKDLALLKKWIASPYWQGETEAAAIMANLDSDSIEPMIVELDDKPVAYVQTYDPHMEDAHRYQDQPFGTIGIDLSIGDGADMNKGLGTDILLGLSEMLFEEGVMRLIMDPHPSNKTAIACYKKAGFAAFDTRESLSGPVLMMALDNQNELDD